MAWKLSSHRSSLRPGFLRAALITADDDMAMWEIFSSNVSPTARVSGLPAWNQEAGRDERP